MITISTTSEREAQAMTCLLSTAQLNLDWAVYLLGREVAGERLRTDHVLPWSRPEVHH